MVPKVHNNCGLLLEGRLASTCVHFDFFFFFFIGVVFIGSLFLSMPSKKTKKKASLRAPLQQQTKKKKKKRARPSTTTSQQTTASATTTHKKQRVGNISNNKIDSDSTKSQQHTLSNLDAIEVGSKALRELVKSRADLCYLGSGKVQCSVTKHEMKPVEDVVRQHLASKRYTLELGYQKDYDYLLPWIKPHHEDRRKLVCTLTGHELNKIPSQLTLHTESKRFIRLKKEGEVKLKEKGQKEERKETRRREKTAAREAKLAAGETVDEDELGDGSGSGSESENSDEDGDEEDIVEKERKKKSKSKVNSMGNSSNKKSNNGKTNNEQNDDDDMSWILRG